ncbi:MAG: MmcQ/YjbR family DNA-binding protein [Rhizomicrobium sp.]
MTYVDVEKFAQALPGATLGLEYGGHSNVFRVGGKLFLMIPLDANWTPKGLRFKTDKDTYRTLTRLEGIHPCPTMTRAHWVEMDGLDALSPEELKSHILRSHAMVAASLPRTTQVRLGIDA